MRMCRAILQYLPSAIVVAERLSCHRCLSVCPQGEVYTPRGRHPSPGRHDPMADTPMGSPPGRHPSLPRWPLQWTVRIILECILVFQYEDKRIQEFTEPDYQKLMALKEEDRKYTEEWLAFKESNNQTINHNSIELTVMQNEKN